MRACVCVRTCAYVYVRVCMYVGMYRHKSRHGYDDPQIRRSISNSTTHDRMSVEKIRDPAMASKFEANIGSRFTAVNILEDNINTITAKVKEAFHQTATARVAWEGNKELRTNHCLHAKHQKKISRKLRQYSNTALPTKPSGIK